MELSARHRALQISLALMLGTAVVGGVAVFAIRSVLRQDLAESAEAQVVIRVAKLRGIAERLGSHARGFLLTADPESFQRVTRALIVVAPRSTVTSTSAPYSSP